MFGMLKKRWSKKPRLPQPTAESAFFYLTLAIAGWYLSWMLLLILLTLLETDWLTVPLFFLPMLLTAFSEIVTARLVAIPKENRRFFNFAAAVAVLFTAVAPAIFTVFIVWDIFLSPWWLTVGWFFPVLFAWLLIVGAPRRARKTALTAALLWTVALGVLGTVIVWTLVDFHNAYIWEQVDWRGREIGDRIVIPAPWMIAFRLLDAIGYDTGLLLGMAALIGAWLASGMIFAKAAKIRFGALFSKRVRLVLILLAVGYAAILATAIRSEIEFRNTYAALEKRFGRPLDIAAFQKGYETGRKIDNDFWVDDEIQCPTDRYHSLLFIDGSWSANACGPWGEFPVPMLREIEKRMESYVLPAKLAAALDTDTLPHIRPRFRTGEFAGARRRADIVIIQQAGWLFMIDLEAWRLRLALDKRDRETLSTTLRRLNTAVDYLTENAYLGIYFYADKLRDQCRARIVGSGLLNDAELRKLDARLAREEAAMPELSERWLYTVALEVSDNCRRQFDHRAYYPELRKLKSDLPTFGAVFPALWHLFRTDVAKKLHLVLATAPLEKRNDKPAAEQHIVQNHLHRLARLRALRALIAVELEKRRTGKYPAELKDPPLDPFTGRPMKYHVGKLKYSVKTPTENRGFTTIDRTGNGVAVWSVGKNRRDDDGIMDSSGDHDDIRMMFLLPDNTR